MPSPDEIDLVRAQEYRLLATLLLTSPTADLLQRLSLLHGDTTELGRAHTALGEAATQVSTESVAHEHFTLFSGLGRGELLPYASYYLTGFVQGRPLAQLRATLNQLGIERVAGLSEPEDHAAVLLEIMSGLASAALGAPAGTDREFFRSHLEPWISRFFSDLERSRSAKFYSSVGALGRIFMEIEQRGFALSEANA